MATQIPVEAGRNREFSLQHAPPSQNISIKSIGCCSILPPVDREFFPHNRELSDPNREFTGIAAAETKSTAAGPSIALIPTT
jgi:hypothetical protein